jgi:2-hydroxy-3-oxopropionate reductase
MTDRIGFIGLGIMGRPMASNLVRAGYPLWVYARRPEATQPLADLGAHSCYSIRQVAESTDIIITMVADTADVEQVIIGDNGILSGCRAGSIVVDMSTVSPDVTRVLAKQLAECNVEMLDAPVSGGEVGAVEGNLSIMVGGKASVFNRVRPVFEVLGRNIVHVGDHGAGQITKACNQVVVAQNINAVAEALVLAANAGVDPARVREALLDGFAGSRVLEVHGQRMLERQFEPGFRARMHQKDLRIALETANQHGVALPGTAQVAQWLNALVGRGDGEMDHSALITVFESMIQKEN